MCIQSSRCPWLRRSPRRCPCDRGVLAAMKRANNNKRASTPMYLFSKPLQVCCGALSCRLLEAAAH